jgi:hypothetical protein
MNDEVSVDKGLDEGLDQMRHYLIQGVFNSGEALLGGGCQLCGLIRSLKGVHTRQSVHILGQVYVC